MDDRRLRLDARLLGLHAFVVGISWFALGLPSLLLLAEHPALGDGVADAASGGPLWLVLGVLAVVAVYALPLLWPVHLAVGWYELGLVGRLRRGDGDARRGAQRVLYGQGAGFAVVALAVAVLLRGHPGFVAPLAVGGAHVLLGRHFR